MSSQKIVFVANTAFTIINFRKELILQLLESGHEVIAACPKKCSLLKTDDASMHFKALGVKHHFLHIERQGLNPFSDLKLLLQLAKLMRSEKPNIVINYTIKPTIYSSIAAKLFCKAIIFSNITGLGYLFTDKGFKARILSLLVKAQYFLAFKCNHLVFFQNKDDLALIRNAGLLKNVKTKIINGSGVDTRKFTACSREIKRGRFIMIGRILKDKGIYEYVEAARIVKRTFPNAEFQLLGPLDDNPSAIRFEQVSQWHDEGTINYLGPKDDVVPFLQSSEVFVLPSYREGTPRSNLEAMACGLPVITTNAPGCKETVVENYNGFLVPVKNIETLAEKMKCFLLNPALSNELGANSLKYVQDKYEVSKVNNSITEEFNIQISTEASANVS